MTLIARSDAVADDGLPFVAIENAEVTEGGIVVQGTAIAYEATVVIRVTNAKGQVVWHGFATASTGGPARGKFSTTVPLIPGAHTISFGQEQMEEEGGAIARRQTATLLLDTL